MTTNPYTGQLVALSSDGGVHRVTMDKQGVNVCELKRVQGIFCVHVVAEHRVFLVKIITLKFERPSSIQYFVSMFKDLYQ